MAEKTKARQKPKARSRGSTSKARKPSTAKSRKTSDSTSRSGKAKSSSNGAGRVETARHAVQGTAKDAGHTLGNAASKAKVPLLAGGAALAGAAGGLVLGARQSRRHGLRSIAPRRPQVKVKSQDLAKAAKEVGSFGAQMGRLASELQQTREAAGNGKQRSPVEVVLDGLTARRSG
jgi:hypothetical protein